MKVELPCSTCKGKCCTFPAMSNDEYKVIRDKYGLPEGTRSKRMGKARILFLKDGKCPFLTDGSCGVYADRPETCRLYGMVPEMPCQELYPLAAMKAVDSYLERMRA